MDYVLTGYDGMVLEVYEVIEWFPALSTYMDNRSNKQTQDELKGRYEFVGKIANANVRKRYANKSVRESFFSRESNPIKYIWRKK